MFVVEEGDLVEITITNDTNGIHPMHLHGHHVLVLSRDGQPSTGSPWWSDTLNVLKRARATSSRSARTTPGSGWTTATTSSTPPQGLTMHVAYAGVSTPFLVGDEHEQRARVARPTRAPRRLALSVSRQSSHSSRARSTSVSAEDQERVDRVEEADRERHLEADPCEPELDEEQQAEEEAVLARAATSRCRR